MELLAEVIRVGDSRAVRLPRELEVKTDKLALELRDGGVFFYDPEERARELAKRRSAIDRLYALPPLEEELERP